MAVRLSSALKNYILEQGIVHMMAGTIGTGGTASIKFYTCSQPTSGDSGTSGTILCEIISIGFGAAAGTSGATSGTIALCGTGFTGTACQTGTAGWARMETLGTDYFGNAGTFRIDGDVGTSSTSVFVINSVSMTSAGYVSLSTTNITV